MTPADLEGDAGGPLSDLPPAGEDAALAALETFLAGPVAAYGDDRNRPDLEGTSRLSPHLRFGTIHPRQVLAATPAGTSADVFRSEIAWREFYADVLWHRPDSAWQSLHPVGEHLRWDEGPVAEERFAAWVAPNTLLASLSPSCAPPSAAHPRRESGLPADAAYIAAHSNH